MNNYTEKVLSVVAQIPAGRTLSYKEVAEKAGRPRAYRAVGNILNKNYNPATPCHRVIRVNGRLGGYNRGRQLKEALLREEFFNRPALVVAKELLGKFLVRRIGNQILALMITETEAYDGSQDKACHACRGLTPRTKIMFGPAGHWYVYFTYGKHWLLNIVVDRKGYPAAVLIRGTREVTGPARLTKFLKIDKRFNGREANRETDLWIEDQGVRMDDNQIKRSSRIGVAYAQEWAKAPYRFYVG